jgi:exosome complex component CSL4
MKPKEIVLPGDKVAIVEEFMPGEGTYEVDGEIFASTVGSVERDARNKVVRVRSINPPMSLRVRDVVYGQVTDIRSPIVSVEILKARGSNRSIAGDTMASLHISKVSKGYTTDIRNDLRIGDVVKAEVIQTRPSLQLTTARPHLGVVRALCAKCRTPLVRQRKNLYCPKCEETENRKLSKDYDLPPE